MFEKSYIRSVGIDISSLPSKEYYTKLNFLKYFAQGNRIEFTAPVTFFVGENGTGKSTLLEAIAIAEGLNSEGGSKNFFNNTNITHSTLHNYLNIRKSVERPADSFFYRAESFYTVSTEIDRLEVLESYGGKSLHEQSHGEGLFSLVVNRFRGDGLYLMDEPEGSLSATRQLAFLYQMNRLIKLNSQFIICTHSPIISAFPEAEIFEFGETIRKISYQETENYHIYKDFLNSPERFLGELLVEE